MNDNTIFTFNEARMIKVRNCIFMKFEQDKILYN